MTDQNSLMKSDNNQWQLKTANARFGEVFRRARCEGPQYVTGPGKECVVVIAFEEFERLMQRHRRTNLVQFAESPLVGSGIDLERKPDSIRKIKL